MPKIKKLSPQEAQKIAAGEVVERPANIVKELIENAIDAGASKIDIYIKDGGKKLIRVVDNGCGMNTDDAQLCFEHHATSKINSINDLGSITTFGFRGEALSSICSVSEITLITKTEDSFAGTKIELSGGHIHNISETPAAQGTDIAINNVFFNVPARAKFLKKKETEWRHIQQLFQAFCLSYQHIHFSLHHDGKQISNNPITNSLENRLTQVWDTQITKHMIYIEDTLQKNNITISGTISNHQFFRYDRSYIYFFVNNRWVKNYQLGNALLKGYHNVIPAGRHPAACIFITVYPKEIDINTHPRKEEVQFLHPQRVTNALQQAVKQTLEHHLSRQIKQHVTFKSAHIPSEFPQKLIYTTQHVEKKQPTFFDTHITSSEHTVLNRQKLQQIDEANNNEVIQNKRVETFNVVGVYNKTYILLEHESGLMMIDQHAAHERVLYELFSKQSQEIAIIQLMFPQIIRLTSSDLTLLKMHLDILAQSGINAEIFGEDQIIIHATPVHLKNTNLQELIKQMVGWIIEYKKLNSKEITHHLNKKLHAQIACSAAIKAGDTLNNEQIQQLLTDLHDTPNRFSCPHGRPTGWLVALDEIKKKFKRNYTEKSTINW